MKRYILIFIVLVSSHTQSRAAQQADTPLTKAEIMDLVKFGMSSTELIAKINNLGIDFQPSDDDLEALRKAGAQEAVIQALRKANPRPLTREQIGQLVAGGVPSQRAALLVKQRGINFAADAEYLKALRLAGADDELIAALREASRSVPAELTVRTSPGAEVDLDGKPQGRADAQGAWTSKVDPGSHNLKVAMQGMKDFEKSLTLAPGKGIKVEAQLEAAGPAPGEVRTNPKDNLKYVWIPPGIFLMGCSPKDDECQADEKPAHEVTITKGFWMGRTEVTVGAYNHFADATNRKKPHLFLFIGDKKFLSDPKLGGQPHSPSLARTA